MTDVYLITGFLGAGKTTFLIEFVKKMAVGKKIRVIINEFGKTGVDGSLVGFLNAETAEISTEEISGGSIFCACRLDRFEKTVDDKLLDKPDLLVIEASGLSDPVTARKLLENRNVEVNYRGVVCLVDTEKFEKIFKTLPVCARQLSVSGLILLNKTDLAGEKKTLNVGRFIRNLYPYARIKRTVYGRFKPEWLEGGLVPDETNTPRFRLKHGGRGNQGSVKPLSLSLAVSDEMSVEQFNHFLQQFAGYTYRIKGILRFGNGIWLADCVGAYVKVTPFEGMADPKKMGVITVLAGEGVAVRDAIEKAAAFYPRLINFCE